MLRASFLTTGGLYGERRVWSHAPPSSFTPSVEMSGSGRESRRLVDSMSSLPLLPKKRSAMRSVRLRMTFRGSTVLEMPEDEKNCVRCTFSTSTVCDFLDFQIFISAYVVSYSSGHYVAPVRKESPQTSVL